ncbi:Hypothetical predicted protein, partial [Pelobates cultripes]
PTKATNPTTRPPNGDPAGAGGRRGGGVTTQIPLQPHPPMTLNKDERPDKEGRRQDHYARPLILTHRPTPPRGLTWTARTQTNQNKHRSRYRTSGPQDLANVQPHCTNSITDTTTVYTPVTLNHNLMRYTTNSDRSHPRGILAPATNPRPSSRNSAEARSANAERTHPPHTTKTCTSQQNHHPPHSHPPGSDMPTPGLSTHFPAHKNKLQHNPDPSVRLTHREASDTPLRKNPGPTWPSGELAPHNSGSHNWNRMGGTNTEPPQNANS